MKIMLKISAAIDLLNEFVGKLVMWLTLIVVVISSSNAIIRKLFNYSSNAWLELQWYLFGAIFLLASGYTFLRNNHVRVDILSSKLSKRHQLYIEIFGVLFFLLPISILIMVLSWPVFIHSFVENEQSSNAGGLVRWPLKIIVPVGFLLLVLAGISHLIKCVGCLRGACPDPTLNNEGKSSEQELADAIMMRDEYKALPKSEHINTSVPTRD